MIRILLFFHLFAFLFGCNTELPNDKQKTAKPESINAFDTILGDKLINVKTGTIRPDNFQNITKVPLENLHTPSKIYNIKMIYNNLFLIQQKKRYDFARNFDLIVKIEKNRIISYFVLNDFKIVDMKKDKEDLLLLCSNFENRNKHWNSVNEIKILKIDQNFNEIWQYSVKGQRYILDANKITNETNNIKFLINVITGCTICYNIVELNIDTNGKCQSVLINELYNDPVPLKQRELDSIFVNVNK